MSSKRASFAIAVCAFCLSAAAITIDPREFFAYFDSTNYGDRAPGFQILLSHGPCANKELAERNWRAARYLGNWTVEACWVHAKEAGILRICQIDHKVQQRAKDIVVCEIAATSKFTLTNLRAKPRPEGR